MAALSARTVGWTWTERDQVPYKLEELLTESSQRSRHRPEPSFNPIPSSNAYWSRGWVLPLKKKKKKGEDNTPSSHVPMFEARKLIQTNMTHCQKKSICHPKTHLNERMLAFPVNSLYEPIWSVPPCTPRTSQASRVPVDTDHQNIVRRVRSFGKDTTLVGQLTMLLLKFKKMNSCPAVRVFLGRC